MLEDDNMVLEDDNMILEDDNMILEDDNMILEDDNIMMWGGSLVVGWVVVGVGRNIYLLDLNRLGRGFLTGFFLYLLVAVRNLSSWARA